VDRPHELENLRRSLAMLAPGTVASLSGEDVMALITELVELQARLERLRAELRRLADDDPSAYLVRVHRRRRVLLRGAPH
jgi:hypothetical protein